jgi:hypothetical protein
MRLLIGLHMTGPHGLHEAYGIVETLRGHVAMGWWMALLAKNIR